MLETLIHDIDEATVEIDLDAIRHNARLAKQLAQHAKVLAMVKANAYGHGMEQTASALEEVTDYLGVARLSEASLLRESGVKQPIVILSELLNTNKLDVARKINCIPVIFAESNYRVLTDYAESIGLEYWLKIDTGMHRLGLQTVDSVWLQSLNHCSSVITHFHSADTNISAVAKQIEAFNKVTIGSVSSSLSGSASLLDQSASAEIVRPGLMLYGCDPRQNHQNKQLHKAMQFLAPIIDIRTIPAGDGVGYNHRWQASQTSTIATVAAGYGDGYPRHAPNGTPVCIQGHRVPLVGTVSMDMITVDITALMDLGLPISIGDVAELWGKQIDVSEIAQRANTISYELLTGISSRVKRKYNSD